MLALVALAAFPVVHITTAQDISRLTLTRQIALHGSLELDPRAARGIDRARYGGRWYSDKAPGFSFLALPPYELVRAARAERAPRAWRLEGDLHLWLLRVLTGGVAFLAATGANLAFRRMGVR